MRVAIVLCATLFAGCLGSTAPDPPLESGKTSTDAAALAETPFLFTGAFDAPATPATPQSMEFPVEVEEGATALRATLTWEGLGSALRLALLDPQGEVAANGFREREGRLSAATVDPPASGTWKLVVSSERSLPLEFALEGAVVLLAPLENTLRDELQLAANGFAELNLVMESQATFNFSFASSAGAVGWNIHSHENGETMIHREGSAASHAESFTAPKREIYSVLFENGAAPTTLSYVVEGRFRVHSHSQ